MITITEIKNKYAEFKNTICGSITEFMVKHNCTELDVTEFDSTPIIIEDMECSAYTYTLDRVTYDGNDVRVHCSNCEDNDSFYIKVLSLDLLIDLYEWLLENEEFMEF